MPDFTKDELEFALTTLDQLMKSRDLNQTQLAHASGVPQSTISKLLSPNRGHEPTPEILRKLFKGLGLDLNDIIRGSDAAVQELVGYLATPLTGLTSEEDSHLREVVVQLKKLASSPDFRNPTFDLYWPGDVTHPKDNPDFTPDQVYRTDRARASSYNFIVLLCAAPSFGVGQENEIASQAGLSAIRLVPPHISRMMLGSFIKATDVKYSGSLSARIIINETEFKEALRAVQRSYFSQLPLYKGLNGNDFGRRLESLINERYTGPLDFADRLGVDPRYIRAMIDEPFIAANPSARLLKRMSTLLGVSVGFLLGEAQDADPVRTESRATWRAWIRETPGLDAEVAVSMLEEWQDSHKRKVQLPSVLSFRDVQNTMTVSDWDQLYQQKHRDRPRQNDEQLGFFQ
jgi:transcriptional regulator with XRE-family HTH domain